MVLPSRSHFVIAVARNLWLSTRPVTPASFAIRCVTRMRWVSTPPLELGKIKSVSCLPSLFLRSITFAVSHSPTGTSRFEPFVFRLWASLARTFHRERSEEHTSELQSRLHLVCRLL